MRPSHLWIFESASCAGDFAPRGHIGQSRPRQDCISRAGKNALQAKRAHRACGYIFEIRILCRRFCGARPHRAKPPSSGLYLSSGQKCPPSKLAASRPKNCFHKKLRACCAAHFTARLRLKKSGKKEIVAFNAHCRFEYIGLSRSVFVMRPQNPLPVTAFFASPLAGRPTRTKQARSSP